MSKKLVLIIVGILILGGGVGYYIFNMGLVPQIEQPEQTCEIIEGYCIYDNILEGMLYTFKGERVPEELIASSSDKETYFKRIGSETKDIHEIFGIDIEKYTCKNTGTKPVIIEYFYDACEWAVNEEGVILDGCGYDRRAVVCGDVYFIEEYTDWSGPMMYGPFDF